MDNSDLRESLPSKVEIHLYDLSQGMAKQLSPMFLGKQIDGIWHTGIVIYGKEYYFGGGICAGTPKQTPYGYPAKVYDHGETEITREDFEDFLTSIGEKYTMDKYDLFENNCNNFTNECSEFLLSKSIPEYITGLPSEVLNTPMGQMIKPMIELMTNKAMNDNSQQHFSPQPQNGTQQSQQPNTANFNLGTGSQPLLNSLISNSQPQEINIQTNVIPIEDIEMFTCCIETSPQCVIDFYADWCGPCKTIKPVFTELSNNNLDIQFYEVNIDKAREIAQQLGVQSIPTFISYKNGQQVERWTGGNPQTLKDKVLALNP